MNYIDNSSADFEFQFFVKCDAGLFIPVVCFKTLTCRSLKNVEILNISLIFSLQFKIRNRFLSLSLNNEPHQGTRWQEETAEVS